LSATIVGLGLCCYDHLAIIPRMPEFEHGISMVAEKQQGGGMVATALAAASRLGEDTAFLGVVGDDYFGRFIIEDFTRYGVDISHIIVQTGAISPVVLVLIEESTGKRAFISNRATVKPLEFDQIPRSVLKDARYLHLDTPNPTSIAAATFCRQHGVKITMDAEYVNEYIDDLIPLVDVLITSSQFAPAYTGRSDPGLAAEIMASKGPEVVIITLGQAGYIGYADGTHFTGESFKVDVVDTTGAGDVFHGAYIAGLAKGLDYRQAAEFAAATAAMKCTELGGRTGIPTLESLAQFLESRKAGCADKVCNILRNQKKG